MARRIAPLHVIERTLLVQINQHPALDAVPDAGALDLARLKTMSPSESTTVRPKFPRCATASSANGNRSCGEWVFEHEFRHVQQLGTVFKPGAKRLQRREVVGASQLLAQRREQIPVALALVGAECAVEALAEIDREAVVVEQCVVDVEQKHDAGLRRHGGGISAPGLCQPSGPAMMRALAGGPQLPGSYSSTGVLCADEDRIDDAPGGLHRIVAREQRRIAVDRIAEQALVG